MIILWIRKNKTDKQNNIEKKGDTSFEEHDDIMKKFRLAHPDIIVDNPKSLFDAEDNPLQPIQQIKLWENVQN